MHAISTYTIIARRFILIIFKGEWRKQSLVPSILFVFPNWRAINDKTSYIDRFHEQTMQFQLSWKKYYTGLRQHNSTKLNESSSSFFTTRDHLSWSDNIAWIWELHISAKIMSGWGVDLVEAVPDMELCHIFAIETQFVEHLCERHNIRISHSRF